MKTRTRIVTSATLARLAAGFTLVEAAKLARVTPDYLRQVERGPLGGGTCSFALGNRLARIYGCSMSALVTNGQADAHGKAQRG